MPRPLNIFVPHCSDVLTDHLPHGDGLIAHGFMTHLARRGHRLHVAAERVELREPIHPNITLHLLSRGQGALSRLGYMLRVRRLLRRLQRSQSFDLVHQFNPVFTGISLSLAGCGLPVVLGTYVAQWPDSSGLSSVARAQRWVGNTLRNVIATTQQHRASALILTSPSASNRLPHAESVRDRIHYVPHGIDTSLFSPAPGWDSEQFLAAEQQEPSILFLANVGRHKGIYVLIEAFSRVVREIANCKLQVVGGGDELSLVKRRAEELGCVQGVQFLGWQERADTPDFYRHASVYCLPSFGEPYATTVLEAMACGRALVVTNSGGLPYLVHDQGGKKVPAGDPEALAQALLSLLRHPEQRRAMGHYNRDYMERNMSWANVARQVEAVYESVLQKGRSPKIECFGPLAVGNPPAVSSQTQVVEC
ncbi:MAG TPA: glycosyltransferase family 4 protein [Terriglobales bacterium]|jgi:glycosyltransferase involved in cell wall biosynthesis|nr:glycosyltransferase family 4 protein [Terriglobales bacterium]